MRAARPWVACLERALHYCGGVPLHVLCDNPKTIVIERNAYGEGLHRYQRAWLDFVKHYGLRVEVLRYPRRNVTARLQRKLSEFFGVSYDVLALEVDNPREMALGLLATLSQKVTLKCQKPL
jgi:transposase